MPSRAPREDSIYENPKSRRGEFGKNPRKPFPVPALWTYSFGTCTYTLRRRRHFAVIACDGGWRNREREREEEKRKTRPPSFKLPVAPGGKAAGNERGGNERRRERRRKPTVGWLVARLCPFSRFSRLDSDDSDSRRRFTEDPSASMKKERWGTSFSPPLAILIPRFFLS